MGIAALKLLGLLVLLALAIAVLVVIVVLGIALVRMMWVTAVQWRDLFSFDRWSEVLVTVGRNKLRTALTTIAVAWGIFVLVFLLGLGNGLDNGMRKNFARDATNGVWVWANKTGMPYGGYDVGRRITVDNRDYDRATKVRGIDHISGRHFIGGNRRVGNMITKRGGKANSFGVNAVHADAIHLEAHDMAQGRFLTQLDISQRRKSVVIGRPVAEFLFEEGENPVGEWIVVANVPFQVVGVFTDPGGMEQERQMYVPISTAQLAYNGADRVGMLQFTLGDATPTEAQNIIDEVVGQLAERHNFDPTDKQAVRVHNNIEGFARFQQLFWMIATFVTVIGLGTLAAGVVGVSNIMMIAVKERTKEIGVRKALGATPNSIIFMIIQEAVFLTGIAGLLGLSAGVGLLEGVGAMDNEFIYNPGIDIVTGIKAALFLVVAGALAGYFPARAAARVNPITALRDQ
jgi:putative ABC transport system permease protein